MVEKLFLSSVHKEIFSWPLAQALHCTFKIFVCTSGPKKYVCLPYQSKILIKVKSILTSSEWHPLQVVPCASFQGLSLSSSSSSCHFCPSPLLSFHSFCSAQRSTASSLYSHHWYQLQSICDVLCLLVRSSAVFSRTIPALPAPLQPVLPRCPLQCQPWATAMQENLYYAWKRQKERRNDYDSPEVATPFASLYHNFLMRLCCNIFLKMQMKQYWKMMIGKWVRTVVILYGRTYHQGPWWEILSLWSPYWCPGCWWVPGSQAWCGLGHGPAWHSGNLLPLMHRENKRMVPGSMACYPLLGTIKTCIKAEWKNGLKLPTDWMTLSFTC